MSRLLPRDIEVLVTSFGGVGTTFLNQFVARYVTTNHYGDADLLKHLPFPPCSFNPRIRFVYVIGDPIMAVISLFRRKYHHFQSEKLQRYQRLVASPISEIMTLEEYALAGHDKFMFESHFDNWYQRYLLHPTAFIRYEKLWDQLEPLFEFLGLPSSAVDAFPEKKERESSYAGLSPDVLAGLEKMYGGFKKRLERLDDFEVRGDDRRYSRPRIVCSKNMRIVMNARARRISANYLHSHFPELHQRLKSSLERKQNP